MKIQNKQTIPLLNQPIGVESGAQVKESVKLTCSCGAIGSFDDDSFLYDGIYSKKSSLKGGIKRKAVGYQC